MALGWLFIALYREIPFFGAFYIHMFWRWLVMNFQTLIEIHFFSESHLQQLEFSSLFTLLERNPSQQERTIRNAVI